METLVMLMFMFAMMVSLSLTADIYDKVQYTHLLDHRNQIRITMYAQGAVVFWLAGILLYRHVRLINIVW